MDGAVRGLPKPSERPGRIVAVRQSYLHWNAAYNVTLPQVPLRESVLLIALGNSDGTKLAATIWPDVCGGFRIHPLAYYGAGGISVFLCYAVVPRGRVVVPVAAFNLQEASASYRAMIVWECVTEDLGFRPLYATAYDQGGVTSQAGSVTSYDGRGGIVVRVSNCDTGASGPNVFTSDFTEPVGSSFAGTLGLGVGNEADHNAPWTRTGTVAITPTRNTAWAGVGALWR